MTPCSSSRRSASRRRVHAAHDLVERALLGAGEGRHLARGADLPHGGPAARLDRALERHEAAALEPAHAGVVDAGLPGERADPPGARRERLERGPLALPQPLARVAERRATRLGERGGQRAARSDRAAGPGARARAAAPERARAPGWTRTPAPPTARAAPARRGTSASSAESGSARRSGGSSRSSATSTTTPSIRRLPKGTTSIVADPDALVGPGQQVVERPPQGAGGGERLDLGDHPVDGTAGGADVGPREAGQAAHEQGRVMEREGALGHLGCGCKQPAAHGRLDRSPRPGPGRVGPEGVHGPRERVGQLGPHLEARLAAPAPPPSPREKRCTWPSASRARSRRGPRGGAVVLQRHLDHQRAARPRRLAQQRHRVGHVLEHVGQHPEVVGAVGARAACAPSKRSACVDLRPAPRASATALAEMSKPWSSVPTRRGGQRGEQAAVAAADLGHRRGGRGQRPGEPRHVVGLALGAQRPPAPVARRLPGRGGVLLLVDVAQLGRAGGHPA